MELWFADHWSGVGKNLSRLPSERMAVRTISQWARRLKSGATGFCIWVKWPLCRAPWLWWM
jgi:hypothetical protein